MLVFCFFLVHRHCIHFVLSHLLHIGAEMKTIVCRNIAIHVPMMMIKSVSSGYASESRITHTLEVQSIGPFSRNKVDMSCFMGLSWLSKQDSIDYILPDLVKKPS